MCSTSQCCSKWSWIWMPNSFRSITAKAVIFLKYLCGKQTVKYCDLWPRMREDLPFVSRLNILAQFASVCVRVLGFGAWVFPLHAWLCHRIFISLHIGRNSPLLLGVWHHFVLDGSIYHPAQELPLSSVFRGRLFTHEWLLMPLCSLEMEVSA